MDLKADEAALFYGLVIFNIVNGLVIVHPDLDAASDTANAVIVPVVTFEDFGEKQ